MVNSDKKSSRHSESKTDDEDHISSGCVVIEIKQGDIVYVRTLTDAELQVRHSCNIHVHDNLQNGDKKRKSQLVKELLFKKPL